jgi:hypothetical protein
MARSVNPGQHYKLIFFVPETHLEEVKQAVFQAGAGHYDGYDCCSWETLGQGQFRPLDNAQPFIGRIGAIEKLNEYRVETLCPTPKIKVILQALLAAHPYETPAYEVWPIYTIEDF